jgi:lipopolysaccharide/colanic/teichoic acid biosynthesis glycosyltransferase
MRGAPASPLPSGPQSIDDEDNLRQEEPSTGEGFDPEAVLRHWEQPADAGRARSWRRRLLYKKLAWRTTFGLAESLKRGLDIAGAGTAVLVFSPVFVGTAVLIKLEDGGPVLFYQDRVGRGGRLFKMMKFRSMVPDAEALKEKLLQENEHGQEGITFKIKHDPRITRVGRVIRKYSIDEFPQFFNVLRGDMSLVGPRPALPHEVAQYKALHLRRLLVKPGITCLWQVGGRSNIDFEGQVRLDLDYIASESLTQDLKLLLKTIPAVLRGEGAY